jgi:hypothetical protein
VIDRLEEIGSYFHAASMTARFLRLIWDMKGSYWDSVDKIFNYRAKAESEGD